jgi:3'-phosphoadenosine 5'-phosphosulfate synthase
MSTTPISPFLSDEPDVEFVPSTDEQREIENFLNSHPYIQHLRSAHPKWHESRPHLNYPSTHRSQSLTAGTLAGKDRIEVPPYMWVSDDGKELVTISYLGKSLCGHPGVIHGGLLATLLDEGLARCAFASLPNKIGMTASLKVDYKRPTMADSYIVLKAKTDRAEGRKCWVKGHIETLNPDGKLEKGDVLVTAEALMIEPKGAGLLRLTMPHLAVNGEGGQKAAEKAVEIAGAGGVPQAAETVNGTSATA